MPNSNPGLQDNHNSQIRMSGTYRGTCEVYITQFKILGNVYEVYSTRGRSEAKCSLRLYRQEKIPGYICKIIRDRSEARGINMKLIRVR